MSRRILVLLIFVLVLFVAVAGASAYSLRLLPGGQKTATSTPTVSTGTTGGNTGITGNKRCSGVTKNRNGTYSFSWLHVAPDGKIVDESGCAVTLRGFNMGALFLGDAGVGDAGLAAVQAHIAWYKQTFPQMNVVRVNFNSLWWNENVFVPKANMPFRQWLQQYVQWQEQNGNYVQLDEGPHFSAPPCGGSVTFCPSQDQGKKDYQANPNPTTAKELEPYIDPGVQAWTDIAKIYAHDPAILFDAWNEPGIKDLPTFFQDMNTLINTIRAQSPKSLIIVYSHGWKEIMNGSFPDYKQPNLVIDAHIYDGFKGTSPATNKSCSEPGNANWTASNSGFDQLVSFVHSHGQAVVINEWGGCYVSPDYNQQITSFAKAHNVILVYFQIGDVVTKVQGGTLRLNDNGRVVQTDYAN